MGISSSISTELEEKFNRLTRVGIKDAEVKKLIQLATVPNSEILRKLQTEEMDELSTCFKKTVTMYIDMP